jgi:glycosyltransferase involved in cell wall biosynthesis
VRAVVTSDQRYMASRDGRVWTTSLFDRTFFQRYLSVFDEVRVVARVGKVGMPAGNWKQVDGDGVTVHALPHFVGPVGLARNLPRALNAAVSAFSVGDAVILRGGSPTLCLEPFLALSRHPYGLEVVGDPWDVLASGCVQHPVAGFARSWSCRGLRHRARTACAVAYVTEHHLQLRYPPGPKAFSTYYSSADLQDSAFVSEPRRYVARVGEFRLVAVGSMAQRYKAYDILLEAFRQCIETHPNLTLTLVGDGRYRPDLQSLASNLSLNGRVTFAG